MNWLKKWIPETPKAAAEPSAAADAPRPGIADPPRPNIGAAPLPNIGAAPLPNIGAAPGSSHELERRPQEATDEELLVLMREQLRRTGDLLARAFPTATVSTDTRDLLRGIVELDPRVLRRPPPAARASLGAVADPDTPVTRVVEIFEQDPILAQDLMRQANSAFYASRAGRCETLREAVQRVGYSGAHGVLLASTVQGMMCRPGGEYQGMVDKVWAHMVRTAPIARAIAPRFGMSWDQAFLIGLLHDVGKLAIFDRIAELRAEHRAPIQLAPSFLSRLLRVTHAPLGGAIALGWNLGAPTARAIFTHHRDSVVYVDERMSEVVCIAERTDLAISCRRPLEPEAFWNDAHLSGDPQQMADLMALAIGPGADSADDAGLEERHAG